MLILSKPWLKRQHRYFQLPDRNIDINGAGSIETRLHTFAEDQSFTLLSGEQLGPITLAYETHGELNAKRDNAILIFHALSGSHHVAGFMESVPGVGDRWNNECQIGWWDAFVGPGKAIDTEHFFVICANYLGGCYGSTGPCSLQPSTQKPYGSKFPKLSIADVVDSQVGLLDYLGIDRLHAVIGPSLGGLMCLSLATRYPDRVNTVIPIAASLHVKPLQ